MPRRYDIGTLKSPRRMPDGRLVVDAKLTRTGVFTYLNPDGSQRREFRPQTEVFNADSLATFPLTSVTNDHPSEMVTPENAKAVTVGIVGNDIRRLDDHVAAPLVIFDAGAIADIEAGKLELSCGYDAEILDESGTTESGEHYDCIQQNIRINHVAIVDVGRAGPEARIRMDAAVMVPQLSTQTPHKDEIDMELKEALQRIAALEVDKATESARADRAESSLKEASTRADVAEADRDTAKEDQAKAEASRKDADDSLNGRVNGMVKLRCDADAIVPKEEGEDSSRFDGMSERDIKVACIKAVTGFEITKEHSADYVNARYDSAVERADMSDKALGELRKGTELTRSDADAEDKEDKSRKGMMESYKWDAINAGGKA